MIPLTEARAHVLGLVSRLDGVEVPLARAAGLVLAEDVATPEAVPPFDNSAMDGVALRSSDATGAEARVRLVGEVAAGSAFAGEVGAGECVRIMTGAPMPAGADAVQMVERVRFELEADGDGGSLEWAVVEGPVPVGNSVRPAGDDLAAGAVALPAGSVLRPAAIGVLATVGRSTARVVRRPRVGVFSTGDELVAGDAPLAHGQIRDSNRPMLLALVAAAGAEAVDLGHVGDDEAEVAAALRSGAATCDLVLTSGGVSMGDYDPIKAVLLREAGEAARWMQVAIKPAKPLAVALLGGVPVIGLPGNPVSSLVSFELFARPALRTMMGHAEVLRPSFTVPLAAEVRRKPDGKTHFIRVKLQPDADGRTVALPAGAQGSHQLAASATADALAAIPDGGPVPSGTPVTVTILD